MSLEPTVLGAATADAEADIYEVGVGLVAYVKTIALSNRGAAANITQLYIQHDGGASRRIYYQSLDANETELITTPITLVAGDKIRGDAGTADEVDYAIFGAEDISGAPAPATTALVEEIDALLTEAVALAPTVTESVVEV